MNLLSNQKVLLTAVAEDSSGNSVLFTAAPSWTSSDPTVASLAALAPGDPAPGAGQSEMWLVAQKAGTATITVSEDAVAGDNTTVVSGTLSVTVTAAPAAKVVITAGSPVNK